MGIRDKITSFLKGISDIFSGEAKNTEILQNMFSISTVLITDSRTLEDLLRARQSIIDCQEAVKQFGSPLWAVNRLKILNGHWNRRYRLWKLRG